MSKTISTPYGEFAPSRNEAVGISVYKATRPFRQGRWNQSISRGDYFAITHTLQKMLTRPPVRRMYSGDFVARFDLTGRDITPLMEPDNDKPDEPESYPYDRRVFRKGKVAPPGSGGAVYDIGRTRRTEPAEGAD